MADDRLEAHDYSENIRSQWLTLMGRSMSYGVDGDDDDDDENDDDELFPVGQKHGQGSPIRGLM
jgi:hypothetical protein